MKIHHRTYGNFRENILEKILYAFSLQNCRFSCENSGEKIFQTCSIEKELVNMGGLWEVFE